MCDATPASTAPEAPILLISWRYRINLGLFLVLVLSLTFWFHEHLYTYVNESIFVGSSLSIWSVWKLTQSCLKWGLSDQEKSIIQRVFESSVSTEFFILGLIVVAILHFTTTSVYFFYEEAAGAEPEFEIQARQNNTPSHLGTFKVASYQRTAGRPFFLNWRPFFIPVEVSLDIVNPRGYAPVKIELNRWTSICGTSIRRRIPFERKDFHVLCLVPCPHLMDWLPDTRPAPETSYSLRLSRNGRTYTLDNLCDSLVYAGARDTEDIKWLIAHEGPAKQRRVLSQYLYSIGWPRDSREDMLEAWESHDLILRTCDFQPGDSIRVEVWNDRLEKRVVDNDITIPEEPGIRTFYLEVKEEAKSQ